MSGDKIKLFSLSTCGHCTRAKKMLDQCAIDYEFTDVDLLAGEEREKTIEAVKKYNPRCTFPTLVIGQRIIVGFREEELKQALGGQCEAGM